MLNESHAIMVPVRQKNITDVIEKYGFTKSDFSFTPLSNDYFEVRFKLFDHYQFKIHNNNFTHFPGVNGERSTTGSTRTWQGTLETLGVWLSNVKANVDIGDPWVDVFSFQEAIQDVETFGHDEFFSDIEKAEIKVKLILLGEKLDSICEGNEAIRKDIVELAKKSDSFSKKDWLLLLMGLLASWFLSGKIPQESASDLWNSIRELFSRPFWKQLQG